MVTPAMTNTNHPNPGLPVRLSLLWAVGLPLAILIGGTLWFRWSDLDRILIEGLFDEQRGWQWKDFPLFALLYHRGVQPECSRR